MRTFGEAPPPPGFFDRLKSGLAKTGLGEILTKKKLDAETLAELEEALIRARAEAGEGAQTLEAGPRNLPRNDKPAASTSRSGSTSSSHATPPPRRAEPHAMPLRAARTTRKKESE